MSTTREREILRLGQAALERQLGSRAAFLAEACGGDERLRRDVESLLAQESAAGSFIETPAFAMDLHTEPDPRLTIGQRVGIYDVVSWLGAGGMGEVYRARDTDLRRDVALKVLPSVLVADPERLARFEREARVLAKLNHPNVGAIYGLARQDSVRALVLELVDGLTLAERLAQGPLPIGESLTIAVQVAEALEAAHEAGIVHRDLKPANIKVTPSGAVKVLDFGLAKLTGPAASAAGDRAPTITVDGTEPGVIVGTAAYMSPEQARGLAVDKRTDIWAFGCLLYEMLTGRRAFEGEDNSAVLARVLERDPDLTLLPAATPPAIRRLLRRCLEKDRKRRLPDIAAARLEIEEAQSEPASNDAVAAPTPRRAWLAWALAAVLLVTALALGAALYLRRPAIDTQVYRSTFVPPADLTDAPGLRLAISPDGRRLAFAAPGPDGRMVLWVRALDALAAQPLAGTEDARSPFWSPDSRFLGFFARERLKKIDASGGPVLTVSETAPGPAGAWNRDDVILFSKGSNQSSSPIFRVAASGGTPTPVTVLGAGERYHIPLTFLPDGLHFLYERLAGDVADTYVGSLDSPDRTKLFDGWTNPKYASGHLLYVRGTTLMAQAFDPTRLSPMGPPMPLAQHLQVYEGSEVGAFSVSETGVLVYQARATDAEESRLVWFDRAGHQIGVLGDRAAYVGDVSISPDGRHVATNVRDVSAPIQTTTKPKSDIWIFDIARNLRTRFTLDLSVAPRGFNASPIWSPDDERIVFLSNRKGHFDLYQKALNGGDTEEPLLADGAEKGPTSWSPDGRFILFEREEGGGSSGDLWVLPLFGDRKPFPFVASPFAEDWPAFSPDGRWVAYESAESGRMEVYVRPFPGPGGKWQVSNAGGIEPRWRHDGKEIFFLTGGTGPTSGSNASKLMAAAVRADGPHLEIGSVQALFDVRTPVGAQRVYDVSADGRFLIDTVEEQTPITVVVNWPALLRK